MSQVHNPVLNLICSRRFGQTGPGGAICPGNKVVHDGPAPRKLPMRGPKNTSKVRVTKRPFWCEPSAPSRATLARFRTCAPLHLNRTTSASVPVVNHFAVAKRPSPGSDRKWPANIKGNSAKTGLGQLNSIYVDLSRG